MVNNVENSPSSILYDPVSGVLLPGQTMIEDITAVADIMSYEMSKSHPDFKIWQDYVISDPIRNESMGFKYVYFKNGYPLSSFLEEIPSR